MVRGVNMKRSVSLRRKKVKSEIKARRPKRTLLNSQSLLAWYDQHRRILPWRALAGVTQDPYRVWLSEIMLQQTTVAAVGPYFQKFIKRWPTIRHLAKAPVDQVLQMWAGLGYYRRAHLLHACAQRIAADYRGQFPESEAELLELPGFGPYTAAAVAAIAFGQRANVVDGNVERVMARLFALQTPLPKVKVEIRAVAATLLPEARYGDYAQALMDLGATICTPRRPKCGICPLNKDCRAHALGIEEKLPQKIRVEKKPVRRAMAFVLINKKNQVLLRQRSKQGLLGGMMEIPSSVWQEGKMPQLTEVQRQAPAKTKWQILPGKVKHIFSHFELELAVAVGIAPKAVPGKWVGLSRLEDEALPSVMHKIVRHAVENL